MRVSLLALLALAACDAPPPETARDATDPAIAEALAEPVISDVQLAGPSAPDALNPGDQSAMLPLPADAIVETAGAPTLGQVVVTRVRDAAFRGCDPAIGYSAMWSLKLPEILALPKGARLSEAAGSDTGGCALRVVRFGMPGSPATVLDSYADIAKQGGFAVTRAVSNLTATQSSAAFHVDVVAIKGGTRVDLTSRTR